MLDALVDGLREQAEALRHRLVAVRRELHAAAEVGLDLPATQAIILRELEGLGLAISTGRSLSSVTAVLRGGAPGPVVLLRADMDALPITETTGLDFAAASGAMHACGHDLHMAGLLGAVRLLVALREELPGTVVFMFQPGEEGQGGGRIMVEEGVLDAAGERAIAAYALHVDSATPHGRVVTREGAMMASASALRLVVRGTGGHAAFPQLAADPVPVAAQLIMAVQSFAARRLPATDQAVISITRLWSDSEASNVLASAVHLEANIRTLSAATLETVRTVLPRVLAGIAEANGCTLESEFIASYPVTYNDPGETRAALALLDDVVGADRVTRMSAPSMASEDFAYVLEQVPGALVFVGAAPPSGANPLHAEGTSFDDSVLSLQAELLAALAWNRLSRA
ncbi:M20 metallopeptidase family protein [Microbacterium sp. zg.Y909]|uniref:M20 metallopeptidase family protein n=1 Tax=Microbacterium sp. zg.Y909 TaxID=2969413 RepID=UPI00214C2369|nr:M20 family metallopeptidase [Microbacterium sp. zg.Y909]MCR2824785.1 M20 family metallopeptidase [Microbacterium sp. zg.Y909]